MYQTAFRINKKIFAVVAFIGILTATILKPYDNQINYGFDKVQNTYLFKLNGNFAIEDKFGKFQLKQNYYGTSLSSIEKYFRDDQSLTVSYKYPIINALSIGLQSNYLLNSDSKSSGINKLQRLNGIIEGDASIFDAVRVRGGYGIEDHRQGDLQSAGRIWNMNYATDNLDYEGFVLRSNGNYEQLNLNHDRCNSDLLINANLSKSYDEKNNITFDVSYKSFGRDYIQPQLNSADSLMIESRQEDRISSFVGMNFNLNDNITSELNFNLESSNIDRHFNKPQASNNYSFVKRTLATNIYGFSGTIKLEYGSFTQQIGMISQFRNESNFLQNRYELTQEDYSNFLSREKQRDNQNSLTRLFGRSLIELSASDTVAFGGFASINRYDTPSENNYDDRDEFQGNFGVSYSRVFSDYLTAKFLADITATHLVFLKSQRSSLNNWNRVIRLNPIIEYTSESFSMKPSFELLANYTAYDYENESSGSKSYSFRQISYSDTLKLKLYEQFSCESRVFAKYNERAILYWRSFSETPQQANYEIFANLIFFANINDKSRAGIGARFYKLRQYNLPYSSMKFSLNQFYQESIGPEINIFIQLSRNSNVIIKGWYEFRSFNNGSVDDSANLILQTNFIL